MSHLFTNLYRLRVIRRWRQMRDTVAETVAEDSYCVALLAHPLGTIARDVFGEEVDIEHTVTLALYHDVTEVDYILERFASSFEQAHD